MDYDVQVVGGGPIGLMSAIELGRRGASVLVVDRRSIEINHPKANTIDARTMEMFRQLGLADGMRRIGEMPGKDWSSWGYTTRLAREEIGVFDMWKWPARMAEAEKASPEMLAFIPQDAFEPLLRARATKLPNVTLQRGVEAVAITQDEDGVTLTVRDAAGEKRSTRSRYLIGADGARSFVRNTANIGTVGPGALGCQLNTSFEADLEPYTAGRKHVMWWIVNADTHGVFVRYAKNRWSYCASIDLENDPIESYSDERSIELIQRAIGTDDPVDIRIRSRGAWFIEAAIANSFRAGRVLLAGDAAHRFPPTLGLGMNSGLQDAQNLAWKLHLVLRGLAGDDLLDSYDQERRATAHANAQKSMETAQRTASVGFAMADPAMLARIEGPDGKKIRQDLAEAIPSLDIQYWTYGLQFGQSYNSSAVIDDGSSPAALTVSDYVPNGRPGSHAPHLWLQGRDGERLSTVDLLHSRFVLLTTPAGTDWLPAAKRAAEDWGGELVAFVIGQDGDYEAEDAAWADTYGIAGGGAVLVRPDGYIAFRSATLPKNPSQELADALKRLFGTRHDARVLQDS